MLFVPGMPRVYVALEFRCAFIRVQSLEIGSESSLDDLITGSVGLTMQEPRLDGINVNV